MASTAEEIREVLADETTVNLERLREAASRGLPDDNEIRTEVWLHLLGVLPPNKAAANLRRKKIEAEYTVAANNSLQSDDESGKRIAFDVNRIRPKDGMFREANMKKRIKDVLAVYTVQYAIDYDSTFAQMISPLAAVIQSEAYLYAAFCSTMKRIGKLEPLNNRCSTCLALLRSYLPDLHTYFEDEEVSINEVMESWLKGMLVAQIPLSASIQLWDVYLSQGFDLHTFVCIGILIRLKDELEELEGQEVAQYLTNVPISDVDEVLVQAENLASTSRNIL